MKEKYILRNPPFGRLCLALIRFEWVCFEGIFSTKHSRQEMRLLHVCLWQGMRNIGGWRFWPICHRISFPSFCLQDPLQGKWLKLQLRFLYKGWKWHYQVFVVSQTLLRANMYQQWLRIPNVRTKICLSCWNPPSQKKMLETWLVFSQRKCAVQQQSWV